MTTKIGQALVVLNPIAGGQDNSGVKNLFTDESAKSGIQFRFFETSGDDDAGRLKAEINNQPPDVLIAAGGDGTVHLAASAVIGAAIPLAIVPLGSGNGLSKDLNIPQQPEEAMKLLQEHDLRSIDTLLINGKLSVHLMDLGFNALVVKRFEEAPTRGPATYAKVAMQEYLSYEPKPFRIETDGGNFEGKAFMITVTNANNFGSNATVNPYGILNDGLFEVCILEPFPKPAAVGILYKMYNEIIHESEYSTIIRCSKATIYNLDCELMQIDGEVEKQADKIEVVMQPKSLKVLLPHSHNSESEKNLL